MFCIGNNLYFSTIPEKVTSENIYFPQTYTLKLAPNLKKTLLFCRLTCFTVFGLQKGLKCSAKFVTVRGRPSRELTWCGNVRLFRNKPGFLTEPSFFCSSRTQCIVLCVQQIPNCTTLLLQKHFNFTCYKGSLNYHQNVL